MNKISSNQARLILFFINTAYEEHEEVILPKPYSIKDVRSLKSKLEAIRSKRLIDES